MSGHSKWHNIQGKKGVADAKRGAIFSKLAKNLTLAAKEGSDPTMNFKLRMAVDAAKAVNMPKDNIERAIARGSGASAEGNIEEIIYEGLGPDKTPFIVKVLTDNRNRASSNLKHIFSEHGGNLGAPVMWQFDKKGVIRISAEKLAGKNIDELELQLIDLGVQDIKKTAEGVTLISEINDLKKITDGLVNLGLEAQSAEPEFVAKEKHEPAPESAAKLESFINELDEDEDVDNYYTNS